MFNNIFGKSLIKKRELQFREANGGAIALQDIFDYVDIAIAENVKALRQEMNNPQNVKVNAEIDKASLAAAEKAIAAMFDTLK